jgi:predicted AAA+ superfamily ATPase
MFNRKVLSEIKNYLDFPEALILTGARQVGKTTIMRILFDELKAKDKHVLFVDLEDHSLLSQFNESPTDIYQYIIEEIGNHEKIYLFVDEIQYMANPSNLIKYFVDHYKQIKIIASGSSTLQIKQKFEDALVGRKIEFPVFQLDFEEYLHFKGEDKLVLLLNQDSISEINHSKLLKHFNRFTIEGGYPRVALLEKQSEKERILNEIVQAYIYKDIAYLFKIENITGFNLLLQLIANQCGQLFNLNQVQNVVKLNKNTIERYLFILENTFIIKKINPFFNNKTTEISKMGKIYIMDNGIRNLLQKNFNKIDNRLDGGALLENMLFTEIYKNKSQLDDIKFWRTKSGNEVDFIVDGKERYAIEVKSTDQPRKKMPVGLKYFKQKYNPVKTMLAYKGIPIQNESFSQEPVYSIGSKLKMLSMAQQD